VRWRKLLAYNFNDSPGPKRPVIGDDPEILTMESPAPTADPGNPSAESSSPTSDQPASASFIRFRSCRWHQPAESGNAEFCTHREVKPYAGTSGFDADAWCPDCQYYKLRRAPKKRNPDDYSY
jgi:hypothetical protein